MSFKTQIESYIPFDEQEKGEKEQYLKFIDTFDDVLTRKNEFGHMTCSAFVVNKERDKMLVVYHNINDGWIYPGGHADGEKDFLSIAIREVEEETGLKATVLDKSIFAIQSNTVPPHWKNGKYVPAHVHYDVIYLFEADDTLPLKYREEESKGVKWVDFETAVSNTMVFSSLHERFISKLKNQL